MAKKTNPSPFSVRAFNLFLIACVIINLCVVYHFETNRSPRVVHATNEVFKVLVVTNFLSSSSSSVGNDSTFIDREERKQTLKYSYGRINNQGVVWIDGIRYSVGDRLSYGVITYVGSDCILTDTGVRYYPVQVSSPPPVVVSNDSVVVPYLPDVLHEESYYHD